MSRPSLTGSGGGSSGLLDSGQIVVNTQHVPYSVATMGRSSRAPTRGPVEHPRHPTQERRSRSAHSLNRSRQQQELRPYVVEPRSPSRPGSRPGTFGAAQGRDVRQQLSLEADDEKAMSSSDGNWFAVNEAKAKAELSSKNSLAIRNEAKAKQMAASMQEELRREREVKRGPPSSSTSSGYGTSQGGMSTPSSRIISTPAGMARAQSPGGNLSNGGVYRMEAPRAQIIHRGVSPRGRPTGRFLVHQPQFVVRNRPTSPQYRMVTPSRKVAPAHALAIARAQSPGYGMTLHRQGSPHRPGPRQVIIQRIGPKDVLYVSGRHPGQYVTRDPGPGRYQRSRRGSSASSSSGSKYRNPLLREKSQPPVTEYPVGARNRSSSVPDIFLELSADDNFFPQTLPRNFGAQPHVAPPEAYHSSTVPRKTKRDLVYRGEFVKVAVPRYKVEEDNTWVATNNNRNSLLISKTYHSEPNLAEAQDDDEDVSMRLSLLPPDEDQSPVSSGQLRLHVTPQQSHSRQLPVQSSEPRTPLSPGVTYFNSPNTPKSPGTPATPSTPVIPRSPLSPFSFSGPEWWVSHVALNYDKCC